MNTYMRFMLYLAKRLTAIIIVAILIILATFIGYDYANVYVIVNEGITQRAQVILEEGDSSVLSKFYTQDYLEREPLLANNPYKQYIVKNYDLRVKIKKLWTWPWNDRTKVTIEEIITGIEAVPREEQEEASTIPQWSSGEKLIIMKKDGRWRISDIILKKPIDPVEMKEESDNSK